MRADMKAQVLDLKGQSLRSIELPRVFESEIQPDLIKRAVLSIQSARKQPRGNYRKAGIDNTARYIGYRGLPAYAKTINIDHARLPRMNNRRGLAYGRVARVPQSVGGRRAHPPKVEERLTEELNKKERQKALQSAIAATAQTDWVTKRGHIVSGSVPVILDNAFEALHKTRDVTAVLQAVHVLADVARAKARRTHRAGKSKTRLGRYKRKKSVLIVTGSNSTVYLGARNLEGVQVVEARNLNVELLAPGCHPGRLTLYTENALQELDQKWGKSK